MKDKNEKIIGQIEKDNVLLDFVNYQAQEAILSPVLPETKKDEILNDTIRMIQQVAERKAAYYAKYGEGRRTRRPHIIYEARNYKDEEQENTPPIIAELSDNLTKDAPGAMQGFMVEWIAEKAGINKNILYEWAESDTEFTAAVTRLKDAQKNDPFKTGTEEDTFVNSIMIALLLLETREKHFKNSKAWAKFLNFRTRSNCFMPSTSLTCHSWTRSRKSSISASVRVGSPALQATHFPAARLIISTSEVEKIILCGMAVQETKKSH